MSNLNGKALSEFAISKVGTPYVYGAKGSNGKLTQEQLNLLVKGYPNVYNTTYLAKAKKYVGKVCTDCSGLISWYTGKGYGSYQLYRKASERMTISEIAKAPVGAVLWKCGHVGVYNGENKHTEAKGINYGVVTANITTVKWTHILLYNYIDYGIAIEEKTSQNPYSVPVNTLSYGSKGEEVKWLQWELLEAGLKNVTIEGKSKTLTINGDFDKLTETAVKVFQQSSKITMDGIVGEKTVKALIEE